MKVVARAVLTGPIAEVEAAGGVLLAGLRITLEPGTAVAPGDAVIVEASLDEAGKWRGRLKTLLFSAGEIARPLAEAPPANVHPGSPRPDSGSAAASTRQAPPEQQPNSSRAKRFSNSGRSGAPGAAGGRPEGGRPAFNAAAQGTEPEIRF